MSLNRCALRAPCVWGGKRPGASCRGVGIFSGSSDPPAGR